MVVALGGNALVPPRRPATLAAQAARVAQAVRELVPFIRAGHRVVITHGNGFQVGQIMVRVEESLGKAYALPLELCVAESQGEIGYLVEQALQNALTRAGVRVPVVSLLTLVRVDAQDPAFRRPTKPIGPAYSPRRAAALRRRGFAVAHEAGRGWRRVVPSPRPLAIDDAAVPRQLLDLGAVVVAAGGGGVPVVRRRDGTLRGVEAVVDKDLASAVLARGVGATRLVFLTGARSVHRDHATPRQRRLARLSVDQARRHLAAGQFPPGSMGPKIEAAIAFLQQGGRSVLVTAPGWLARARAGRAGTLITRTGRERA